jgi:muramoyltetrapeptide carboxypeptidase
MLDCASPGTKPEFLEEVISSVFHDFEGPIAIGLRSGHVSRHNVTLTFGVTAELEVQKVQGEVQGEAHVRLLETAVAH